MKTKKKENELWHEAFITGESKYILLDDNGTIRATGYDIVDITKAKIHFGWGKIHRMAFDNGLIEIGELIE